MRMGHNIVPYAYGISHTRTGYPIRVWDVPYAYGPIYTYGAEHIRYILCQILPILIIDPILYIYCIYT